MIVKYIHISDPTTEKLYDTEKVFRNPNNPRVFKTQQEFDAFELNHFAENKKRGIIISYEIIKEEIKMKLHYYMTAQEWKDLLNYLSARGCKLVYFPETDQNGLFVDFKYALVEYNGMFFYMDCGNWNFSVCKYCKVSPYEKQQSAYSREPSTAEALFEYISTQIKDRPIAGTHKQRIFLTELYSIRDGRMTCGDCNTNWRVTERKKSLKTLTLLPPFSILTTIMCFDSIAKMETISIMKLNPVELRVKGGNMIKLSTKLIDKIEEHDFSITESENDYYFGKYSSEGQDFGFYIDKKDTLDEFADKILYYYEAYDPSEEASLWLGPDGHGKNGAPYRMIDVYNDMVD